LSSSQVKSSGFITALLLKDQIATTYSGHTISNGNGIHKKLVVCPTNESDKHTLKRIMTKSSACTIE